MIKVKTKMTENAGCSSNMFYENTQMKTTVVLQSISSTKRQALLAPLRPAEQCRNRTVLYNSNIPVTMLIYIQITAPASDSAPHCTPGQDKR